MSGQTELSVLGAMMNDRACFYESVAEIDERFFTSEDRAQLFKAIDALANKSNVDRALLESRAKTPKQKSLIRSASEAFVNTDAFKLDLSDIKDSYIKKQLGYTINQALQSIQNDTSAEKVIASIEQDIGNLYFDDTGKNIVNPEERAPTALEHFYEKLNNPEINYGLRFSVDNIGFPSLDEVFMGARKGDLILIAAKTGEGKTALAINFSRIFSFYQKYSGYYANAEMALDEMESRLLAPIANVTAKEIFSGQLEGTQFERDEKVRRIGQAYNQYQHKKIYLSELPDLTLTKTKALARQVRNRFQSLDYLVIDYIGRMEMDYSKGLQEWQILYEITKQSKKLAMQLGIPVFILAQRNHDGNIEGAKKIANECDGVLYFEPTGEKDEKYINQTFTDPGKRQAVNYKMIKRKIRRDDNPFPIYCSFDKKYQAINEVTTL
jgi:replicative DNA helicase